MNDPGRSDRRLPRRQLLATSVAVGTAVTAGCAAVADVIGDIALEDVNILNGTAQTRNGAVSVTGPDGSTLLEESFLVEPEEEEVEEDRTDSWLAYPEIFDGAGTYTVGIDLDAADSIQGVDERELAVDVTDPAEEHIIVGFTPGERNDPIEIFVIEAFTDIENHIDGG